MLSVMKCYKKNYAWSIYLYMEYGNNTQAPVKATLRNAYICGNYDHMIGWKFQK